MRPVYDDKYFGVKSLLMVEKVLMRKNPVAVLFRRPMQRWQQLIPSCQARSQDLVSRGANICSGGPLGVGPSPPLEVGPLPYP